MTEKRLILVDVSHIAFNFWSVQQQMTWNVSTDVINSMCDKWYKSTGDNGYLQMKYPLTSGSTVLEDTRIPTGIIKNIWRWSNYGNNVVIPCFDRPCGSRKAVLRNTFQANYKEGRSHNYGIRKGLENAERILRLGGVPVLSQDNYEADDLISACVTAFYDKFDKIDVITGDFDLLPLVDDKVSVFLRCRKDTYAEEARLKKNKYVQVTPNSYGDIGFHWTKCSKVELPYNSILLQKMLQGDESDAIPGIMKETSTGRLMRKYPDKKYGELIKQMESDGVDFGSVFRYDTLPSFSKTKLRDVLSEYLTEEDVAHAMGLWRVMDLNSAYSVEDVGINNSSLARGRFEVAGNPIAPGDGLIRVALQYGIHIG